MSIHERIITIANRLGYPLKQRGTCDGATMTWLISQFTQQEKSFLYFLEEVAKNDFLGLELFFIKRKVKSHHTLSAAEKNYLEILSFYDWISLYQLTELYDDFLGKNKELDNVKPFSLATHAYGENEIYHFLLRLSDFFSNKNNEIFGILISNINHSTGLIYYPKREKWGYFDINANEKNASRFLKRAY